MNDKPWSGEQHVMSYNSWLREEANVLNSTLRKNTDRLLVQLQVLHSVISPEEITSERLERVSTAMVHLMTELHLLVTIQENK